MRGDAKKREEISNGRNFEKNEQKSLKNHRNIDEYLLIDKTVKKSPDFTFYRQFSNKILTKNHRIFR